MILIVLLLFVIAILVAGNILFIYESIREQETRAPIVGFVGLFFLVVLAALIIFVPGLRIPVAIIFLIGAIFGLLFLVPGTPRSRSLNGAMGYASGSVKRFDQRDTVISRNRSLQPGAEAYREYYSKHPEKEESDAKRRESGGLLGKMGAIDKHYRPNLEMIKSLVGLCTALRPHDKGFKLAKGDSPQLSKDPGAGPVKEKLEPAKATEMIKGLAKHLGAGQVGVARVDPNWVYSHKEEEWGEDVPEQLPYAIVFATEMSDKYIATSPHTSAEVECWWNYAQGAIVSSTLTQWLIGMGYEAKAHFNRTYELIMPPLAVDAGLGELGRFGYVITDEFGPRARLFVVTTDMPLVPDKPISLGVEEFCERCLKCATTCPSRSIPEGDMVVSNGVMKWKIDDDSCFAYWGKVGTGCSVCMAICPFSRPNRTIHKLVRWFLKRSPLARRVFPHIDNIIYGTKWHSKKTSGWLSYPAGHNHN